MVSKDMEGNRGVFQVDIQIDIQKTTKQGAVGCTGQNGR
jgi:hypothetical protein